MLKWIINADDFVSDIYNPGAPQGGGGGYYAGGPPAPAPDQSGGWNQQFAGQQFLQDPMANMAMQYGTNLADQGKDLVNKKVINVTNANIKIMIWTFCICNEAYCHFYTMCFAI